MTKILCKVENCYYNKQGGCIRERINVDGENAQAPRETMCESYTDSKHEAHLNSCICHEGACDLSNIDCSAENCKYNSNRICSADKIQIGTSKANCCSETECETFKER